MSVKVSSAVHQGYRIWISSDICRLPSLVAPSYSGCVGLLLPTAIPGLILTECPPVSSSANMTASEDGTQWDGMGRESKISVPPVQCISIAGLPNSDSHTQLVVQSQGIVGQMRLP